MKAKEPTLNNGNWTCPPGYAHPRCSGCGHNFFESRPLPVDTKGNAKTVGLCEWCIVEQEDIK